MILGELKLPHNGHDDGEHTCATARLNDDGSCSEFFDGYKEKNYQTPPVNCRFIQPNINLPIQQLSMVVRLVLVSIPFRRLAQILQILAEYSDAPIHFPSSNRDLNRKKHFKHPHLNSIRSIPTRCVQQRNFQCARLCRLSRCRSFHGIFNDLTFRIAIG